MNLINKSIILHEINDTNWIFDEIQLLCCVTHEDFLLFVNIYQIIHNMGQKLQSLSLLIFSVFLFKQSLIVLHYFAYRFIPGFIFLGEQKELSGLGAFDKLVRNCEIFCKRL